MKKLPNIFKPDMNRQVKNNEEVYYSFIKPQKEEIKKETKKNKNSSMRVSTILNNNNIFNKKVLIKTSTNEYKTEILSKMGNNIIIANGKVLATSDILSIDEI